MKIKVAILFGGKSAEHEVSLYSATNIYNAQRLERIEKSETGSKKNSNTNLTRKIIVSSLGIKSLLYIMQNKADI